MSLFAPANNPNVHADWISCWDWGIQLVMMTLPPVHVMHLLHGSSRAIKCHLLEQKKRRQITALASS